jgi:translation elongation factor EF-1beta
MGKKAIIEIHLVPESKDVDNKRIEKEIKESVQCDWLAEIEKVTVKNEP